MRRLAWFASGFGAMCLVLCYVSGAAGPVLGALAALLALGSAAVLLLGRRRALRRALADAVRRTLAVCLGLGAALGWFSLWTAVFRAPADAMAGQELALAGCVRAYPQSTAAGGYSAVVALDGGLAAPDVLVYGGEDWGALVPGDRVAFTAALRPSDRRRGDETTYYTAKGIFLLGYCKGAVTQTGHGDSLRDFPARCARALKESLYRAFPGETAPLAVAILTGDRSGLSRQTTSAMERAGVAHTVAVSGMHVAFLTAVVLRLCRRRRYAAAAIPLLLFYALMAGASPSALRAVLMQAVLLAAPIAGRDEDGPTSLGFALLALLVLNPYAAGSVSLQLSFTSVAGLMACAEALEARLTHGLERFRERDGALWRRWAARLWSAGAASVSISLGAMAFTAPLLCLYFGRISLVFPLANLLILWAVSLFFLLALAVGAAGVLWPGAAALGGIAALPGRYILWVTSALGGWNLASVPGTNPYYLLWLGAVYLFLALGFAFRRQRVRPAVPAACLGVLLAAALLFTRGGTVRADLTVAVLDVGQGAATALVSGGRACLVDCGSSSGEYAGDAAADYFASMGMKRLDLLVLTHFDADHCNGVEQLFARMEVGTLAVPALETCGERAQTVFALAAEEGAQVLYVGEQTRQTLGRSTLTLYPPLGSGTSNEEGLFALCTAGEFDVLITGDADAFVERMLVKYCDLPDIELLLAGHHGSAGSTSEQLLDALRPELAIISVGYNTYGHPSDETLRRLEGRGISVYRTDTMGTVTIEVRSDGYAAQSER